MAKTALPKTYDFTATEQRLYEWWEKMGFFQPGNDPNEPNHDPSKKPFVISIPPANVTGKLHLGHAMFVSMEDLMIRYHRMKGEPTLWVPGIDHAGIATQLRVEETLREQGTTREEVGREKFEEITWAWKHEYGGHITNQIRRLGASCDWSRERFTLDDGLSKAVREAFVTLFEQGLIYRGPRLINWSPGLQTAVSDLEVEYSEESGFMYHFRYMLADGSGDYLPVATTRPETILGDSGVAVHPEDPRYQKYIGKKVLVPMLNREIPVIADDYVDREFGTGALKVTPGHDPNDYEIGSRHNLEFINMMTKKATINENGGIYEGMDRFECRKRIWADMKEAGLVIKEEPYTHQVPRSQRGGEIIEPLISTQWFVNIKPLAEKAIAAVRDGRTKIIPERFEKVYFNWMENIRDWCISRQLWWGHRIPVWYCDDCGKQTIAREDPTECAHCGSKKLQQDPDVLDTWFSSGLWPFSTLGWPEETPDLKYFYPTSVLETGYDILFFWVARMMMDGLWFTNEVPFHTIYLHGLIRDEHGQKMSKSKGNVVDPLITMDEFGTDALRFTLLVGSTPGNDMNLSLKKVEGNRNFANKVWNMARFIIGSLEKAPRKAEAAPQYTLADSWIWAKMNEVISSVERLFGNYLFGEAGRQIYDFLWGDFADWYLEIAKLQLSEGGDRAFYTAYTLTRVLDNCLRLLHPYTPFVTEELWQHLKDAAKEHSLELNPKHGEWEDALIIARWPEAMPLEGWENDKIAKFEQVQEVVRSIRNIRAEKKIQSGKKIPAIIVAGDFFNTIQTQATNIARLANLDTEKVKIIETLPEPPQDAISTVTAGIAIYLPLMGMVDTAAEKERLQKELKRATSHIERLEKLLSSPFTKKAPTQVVANEREKLASFQETAAKLHEQLEALN
ncbi:MAG: valine--tRNA ligase [Anaerolineaceae bacterium]|nr:valine--tRNA ligase [Anaerolineaceae bacterium]